MDAYSVRSVAEHLKLATEVRVLDIDESCHDLRDRRRLVHEQSAEAVVFGHHTVDATTSTHAQPRRVVGGGLGIGIAPSTGGGRGSGR